MTGYRDKQFFVTGGSLEPGAPSYVVRPADEKLTQLLLNGNYCNVLTSRQVGKSSLVIRTVEELRKHNIVTAYIDISHRVQEITPNEWYLGLVQDIKNGLQLNINLNEWWKEQQDHSPIDNFIMFIEQVVLHEIKDKRIIIFIDEIDASITLDFTDDFFIAIRGFYNQRAVNSEYKRISFVLVGAVRPSELIKNRRRTPYNIGEHVELLDFTLEQMGTFIEVMDKFFPGQGRNVVIWVLKWSGGQPYLTQKLCAEIVKSNNQQITEEVVEHCAKDIFLSDEILKDEHFNNIKDRINSSRRKYQVLSIYKQVYHGKDVKDDALSPEVNELKLLGLVKISQEGFKSKLVLRNKIYQELFNDAWIKDNTKYDKTRGLIIILFISVLIAVGISIGLIIRQRNITSEIQADTYLESFHSNTSPEVRVTNLAGLLNLGGKYTLQGKDLYHSLSYQEQIDLFNISQPQNVGTALVKVVCEIYQDIENSPDGNELLSLIAQKLTQLNTVPDTLNISTEIELWLQGREWSWEGRASDAIMQYNHAYRLSEEREQPNYGILYDRALLYITLSKYHEALIDFELILEINPSKASNIKNYMAYNSSLYSYWVDNRDEFSLLSEFLPTPTSVLTSPTLTQIPFPTITQTSSPTITSTPIPSPTLQFSYFEMNPFLGENQQINSLNAREIEELGYFGRGQSHDIDWSPSGDVIAVSSSVGVYLYDAESLNQVLFLGTGAWVNSVSFSNDGELIASGADDKVIRIWNSATGSLIRELKGHTDWVYDVIFSPDNETLISTSLDHTIRIWRISDGYCINIFYLPINGRSLALSNDGTMIAAGNNDGEVMIIDPNNGGMINKRMQQNCTSQGFDIDCVIRGLAFSPDGQFLASASNNGFIINIWQISNGSLIETYEGYSDDPNTQGFMNLSLSTDGTKIASGGENGVLWIFGLHDSYLSAIRVSQGRILGVDFSPDGEEIITGSTDGLLNVWRISDGQLLRSLEAFNGEIVSIVLSTDGSYLASLEEESTFRIWNLVTEEEEATFRIWNLSTDSYPQTIRGQLSMDTRSFVNTHFSGTKLGISTENGLYISTHNSNDGHYSLYVESDSLILLDTQTGITNTLTNPEMQPVNTIGPVAFSNDNHLVAAGVDYSGTVLVWDIIANEMILNVKVFWDAHELLFSPAGNFLVAASSSDRIYVWDINSQSLVSTWLVDHNNLVWEISCIALSPDGTLLATAGYDMIIRIWNLMSGTLIMSLNGHSEAIKDLLFSPDGTFLASASRDGTIRFWGIPIR